MWGPCACPRPGGLTANKRFVHPAESLSHQDKHKAPTSTPHRSLSLRHIRHIRRLLHIQSFDDYYEHDHPSLHDLRFRFFPAKGDKESLVAVLALTRPLQEDIRRNWLSMAANSHGIDAQGNRILRSKIFRCGKAASDEITVFFHVSRHLIRRGIIGTDPCLTGEDNDIPA